MSSSKSIIAHYVGLVLPGQLSSEVIEAVRRLAAERGADYALMKNGPEQNLLFLHKKDGRLSFKSGLLTISANLHDTPVQKLDMPHKNPMNFFRKQHPAGVNRDLIIAYSGDTFSPESLRRLSTRTARLIDPTVRLTTLLNQNELDVNSVTNIANARCHLMQESKDCALDHLPDLDGPVTLRYRKHVDGVPVPNGPFKDVTFIGRPDQLLVKRKHYWMYSGPGFGKSTTTRQELVEKYKAALVPHPKNAVNIPDNAQLLVFDEIGPNRKVPIEQLKGLCGGDSSSSYLNRKSYGQSYVPRKDAQLVILSNHSPYDVYAKYRTGRDRRIDTVDMQALEERFHVIRLDGDNLDEKRNYVNMGALSEYEYTETLYERMYDNLETLSTDGILKKVHIRDALKDCYQLYLDRHAHRKQILSTDTFIRFVRSFVHEDDWPVFEEVHRQYAQTNFYGYNTVAVDDTIVKLPARRRPDAHVPPTPFQPTKEEVGISVPANIPRGIDGATKTTTTRRPPSVPSTCRNHEQPDTDPTKEELTAMMEMVEHEVNDDGDAGHVDAMEVDDDKVASVGDVMSLPRHATITLPSSTDASSFATVQRLDPEKTHEGHVVVSNNGGPRRVIPLEHFHPPSSPVHTPTEGVNQVGNHNTLMGDSDNMTDARIISVPANTPRRGLGDAAEATKTCRPPPVPSTYCIPEQPYTGPDDDEIEAMMEMDEEY
jgi:hypothetical protein